MAINDRNTLNDTQLTDPGAIQSTRRDVGTLPNPGPEYDHVLSVFVKIMKDPDAAAMFAEALYRVSAETETPVLTLLNSLDVTDEMTLNTSMAYFLNGINSPSTLYGVQTPLLPNYYAGRNVLS
jgi:hypothetical protein